MCDNNIMYIITQTKWVKVLRQYTDKREQNVNVRTRATTPTSK